MTTSSSGARTPSGSSLQRPGGRLAYTVTGSRGPAVLLVQGVGVVGEGWRPQIDALADRYRVVAFDNPGMGGSEHRGGPLTIESIADDALAVLHAERIDRFHLVGHSMGGLIAQEIALVARRRVRSLSFLCTFARGKQGARLTWGTLAAGLRTRIGTRRMRRDAFCELVIPRSCLEGIDRAALAERLGTLFGRDLADSPPIIVKQLSAMARYDVSSRLGELASIPALVLSASEDRIALPAHGRALAAAIPGARLLEIPHAGHGVTIHLADRINEILDDHFQAADRRERGTPVHLRFRRI